jgi:hypothetical protein
VAYPAERVKRAILLHAGCGVARLDGWIHVDRQVFSGIDFLADLSRGLPVTEADAVFAEHFLEHLDPLDALVFLSSCADVLRRRAGWLRLSTPNLDWVLAEHYRPTENRRDRAAMAVTLNRAFRGWGHRFLWNDPALRMALDAAGFGEVRSARYGESPLPIFKGIERHETYRDLDDLRHVLIFEARAGAPNPERFDEVRSYLEQEFANHLESAVERPISG